MYLWVLIFWLSVYNHFWVISIHKFFTTKDSERRRNFVGGGKCCGHWSADGDLLMWWSRWGWWFADDSQNTWHVLLKTTGMGQNCRGFDRVHGGQPTKSCQRISITWEYLYNGVRGDQGEPHTIKHSQNHWGEWIMSRSSESLSGVHGINAVAHWRQYRNG